MEKKVGVILSGCGVRDGSEIHESVLLMAHLCKAGFKVVCMAPAIEQRMVVDHLAGSVVGEKRNVMVESARIARGEVLSLDEVNIDEYDAFVLPGGYGAALNLCDFAVRGVECEVFPSLRKLLLEAHEAGKVLGFMCIAPVIAAKLFGRERVSLTIGHDKQTAEAIEAMGARHVAMGVDGVCFDERLLILSTPAYMEAKDIGGCYDSAAALVSMLQEVIGD